ncbi:unnamed protein product [Paramecium sonneborni]|uniref:Transmembrane protein n=1 Tax=Paramecium sonneborni TaxID=65129 RepID=A0A8S1PN94_9CILI|nr:unnamed protein product [Paramecium sonneborni]
MKKISIYYINIYISQIIISIRNIILKWIVQLNLKLDLQVVVKIKKNQGRRKILLFSENKLQLEQLKITIKNIEVEQDRQIKQKQSQGKNYQIAVTLNNCKFSSRQLKNFMRGKKTICKTFS